MDNLAVVLSRQGKHEAAEEMHRRGLKLSDYAPLFRYPDTLTSMNNLALVLSRQGKHEAAEEMHRRALQLREKAAGPEHTDTPKSRNNLPHFLIIQVNP